LIYILVIAAAVTVALGEYIDSGVIAAVLALNGCAGPRDRAAIDEAKTLLPWRRSDECAYRNFLGNLTEASRCGRGAGAR
jgi:hypothetical protein